jgi:hypothetical protein
MEYKVIGRRKYEVWSNECFYVEAETETEAIHKVIVAFKEHKEMEPFNSDGIVDIASRDLLYDTLHALDEFEVEDDAGNVLYGDDIIIED